ncbi:MAG: SCP-like extracellular [Sphingomonas sp.]|nr:SCP-like extracellular [Sphingomonas sp.]
MAGSGVSRSMCIALLLCAPALVGSVGRTTNFDQRLLSAHNRERAAVASPRLEWDPQLAVSAARWAEYLGRTGKFEHSDTDEGENLWAGTRGHYTPEAMVGLWTAEKRHFKPGRFPYNSTTGDVDDVGHYTQLVWRTSRKVGCAMSRSKAEDVLVCRYSEPGNAIGELPL